MADSKRKTANLFPQNSFSGNSNDIQALFNNVASGIVFNTGQYVFTVKISTELTSGVFKFCYTYTDDSQEKSRWISKSTSSVTIVSNANKTIKSISITDYNSYGGITLSEIMLNSGSTALPYEPYGWVHSLRKLTTVTDAITTLPVDIYADGNNATVGISGNTVQSGTPTPDNPIMPQGCGDMTDNLLDATMYDKSAISYAILSMPVTIPIVTLTSPEGLYTRVVWTKSTGAPERVHTSNWIAPENSSTFELALYSDADCFKIEFRNVAYSALTDEDIARRFNIMLNSGSTALPYEPYGVKIPISSASTTTPIYLGEVESARRIKKLVLTGEEDITSGHLAYSLFNIPIDDYLREPIISLICTHYIAQRNVLSWEKISNKNTGLYVGMTTEFRQLYIRDSSYSTIADFKSYLAQQYAAGTPVTVWYVLETEETGIVNEPLMKIGDYADTVSGISIPTITGKDTFDVDTTLKPSEVSLSYTGWHDAEVKEKSENLFDYNNPLNKIDNVYISTNGTIEASTFYYTCKIQGIENGEYTFRFAKSEVFTSPTVGFYDSSDTLLSVAQHNANVSYFSFITPVNCAYMRVSIFKRTEQEAMLNSGSTALPYEPYWK